jgi:hypothetical protein
MAKKYIGQKIHWPKNTMAKNTIYITAKIPGTLIKRGGAKLVAHLEWDIIHA